MTQALKGIFCNLYLNAEPHLHVALIDEVKDQIGVDINEIGENFFEFKDAETLNTSSLEEAFLLFFSPQHTEILCCQIIFNSSQEASTFFNDSVKILREIFEKVKNCFSNAMLIGYTISYHINFQSLNSEILLDESFFPQVSKIIPRQSLFHELETIQKIKTVKTQSNSAIFLISVPCTKDPSLIYVCLSFADSKKTINNESLLIYEYLSGKSGILQRIDVFAHKAYIQWNSFKDNDKHHNTKIKDLNYSTVQLLNSIIKNKLFGKGLNVIAAQYTDVLHHIWLMQRIQQSLSRQILGVQRVVDYEENCELGAFYIKSLNMIADEVSASIQKSKTTTDTMLVAFTMAEEKQERSYNNIFAALGIIFTLSQIIDNEFAQQLWSTNAFLKIFNAPAYNNLFLRSLISILAGILIWTLIYLFLNKRKKST